MPTRSERIAFRVNGEDRDVETAAARPVLDVLREDLGLTGTKEGCSVGVCGACSVLVDGRLMSACLLPVGAVAGREVTTVEGLGDRRGPVVGEQPHQGRLSAVRSAAWRTASTIE